ncbi:MAG: pyridoxal phosphate-dependent decarboxylase family protein [Gemmatimonadaceae bacterium]
MDDLFAQLGRIARNFRESVRDHSPLPSGNFPAGAELRTRYEFTRATPLPQVVADVTRWLDEGTLHVTHPRYFGLFNPSVHASSIVADALVALYNPQVGGWSHAPAANEIEQWTLRWLAGTLGWPPDTCAAHFTSGGSEANHTAVLAALADRDPSYCLSGARALPGAPRLYVSEESHHSFVKIARACGLGEDALARVPVDDAQRMRPDALYALIAQDRSLGLEPIAIVATAGTTGSGAIDPLGAIADVAAVHDVWLHVDAAWGGSAVLVPRLKQHLAGVERADSLTWDAHKWLSVSMGAGMFFCKHREALQRIFTVATGYVPATVQDGVDLYKESLQWSRRFIGLKLFMALAEHGAEGLAAIVQRQADMAECLRRRLQAAGWRVVNETPLPLVCFTHDAIDDMHLTSQIVVDRVLARGRCWISSVALTGCGSALRACITSFETTQEDLDILMQDLDAAIH